MRSAWHRQFGFPAALALTAALAACSGSSPPDRTGPGTPVGTGGGGPPTTGGTGGTGGSTVTPVADAAVTPPPDEDAAPPADAAIPSDAAVIPPAPDGSASSFVGNTTPPAPGAYGGVGAMPDVPLTYTTTPVPPLIPPECPGDPTAGFTEYQASFKIQRPYDLAAADRFQYQDGIYTFWVMSNDKPHEPGNGTAPRTEARYDDFSSGERIWSADVMYEHVDKTCIMQIHNEVGAYATYLRITGDMMFDLATRKTVLEGYVNKWFNMKVVFNTETLDVNIYINNCLKFTAKSPKGPTPNWYFKHGVYTCDSGTCKSHYKNIHVYQRGGAATPPPTPAATK